MTATTPATEAKIIAVRVGHSGRKIHRAVDGINQSGVHYRYTACGADRRGIGITATYVVDAPINCLACSPAPAAEGAAPAAVPAAATRDEVTEAIPAARFAAVRQNGRYQVVTTGAGAAAPGQVVATCSSKAKAEEKAAKLNADLAADLAEAPAVIADTAKLTEEQAATITRDPVGAVADAIRSGRTDFLGTVGALLGGASLAEVASAPPVGDLPDTVDERGFVRELPRTEVEERVEASLARKAAKQGPAERPTLPEGAVVRHVIVTAAGRLPFASRSRATRAFEAAVAAGQPVAWESAAGRVLRSHPGN